MKHHYRKAHYRKAHHRKAHNCQVLVILGWFSYRDGNTLPEKADN